MAFLAKESLPIFNVVHVFFVISMLFDFVIFSLFVYSDMLHNMLKSIPFEVILFYLCFGVVLCLVIVINQISCDSHHVSVFTFLFINCFKKCLQCALVPI